MNNFLVKVASTIEKFNMANKSERLLVCLSGGADSVTLLLCLYELGYDVCACHVNHHLRGEDSDRDQHFCEKLCEKLGVELKVFHADVVGYCKEHSVSTEEGARKLRYDFFDSIGADKICTAHSLSDCLETAIFNLARGTGLKGICGIPPVRGNIIRPLINCTRQEIEGFLKERGQDFVTDSTNLTDDYTRNKIRHLVVPRLAELNSSLFGSYSMTADRLRTDSDYLESQGLEAFEKAVLPKGYDALCLRQLHESVRRRAIMHILEKEGLTVSHDSIEDIDRLILDVGKANIKGGVFAVCSKGVLSFAKGEMLENSTLRSVKVSDEGIYQFGNKKIEFKFYPFDGKIANVHKKFANCCLDYDKIKGEIVVENRREGEKIRLVNRDFDSDVRKLVNKSFRLEDRSSAVILKDSQGVVFVEGSGAAERVKIDSETVKILAFTIK